MVYKKYIKRGKKLYGPYNYHSRKVKGKVISEYLGKHEEKNKTLIFLIIGFLLLFSLIFILDYKNTGSTWAIDLANSVSGVISSPLTSIKTMTEFVSEKAQKEKQIVDKESKISKDIISSTQTNLTEINITINTTQYQVILGQPVKWEKHVKLEKQGIVKVKLPKQAKNITVEKILEEELELTEQPSSASQKGSGPSKEKPIPSEKQKKQEKETKEKAPKINKKEPRTKANFSVIGKIILKEKEEKSILDFFKNILSTIIGRIIYIEEQEVIEITIDDDGIEYKIKYFTDTPYSVEENISKGKRITIVGPENLHYENVLAFTEIPKSPKDAIKLYRTTAGIKEQVQITNYQDSNNNGLIDYIEWNIPQLSNQTYELIIEITKAEHLDSNRNFISDIYEEVKALDDIWSETIPSEDYVRITFKENLTNENDITIYPRIINGTPRVEVYEIGGTEIIAEFTSIISNEYNKVLLTNLVGEQDVFDLRVLDGSIEIDYIVDPYYLDAISLTDDEADDTIQEGIDDLVLTGRITRDNKKADGDLYIDDGTNRIDGDCGDDGDKFYVTGCTSDGTNCGSCSVSLGTITCEGNAAPNTDETWTIETCAGAGGSSYTFKMQVETCDETCRYFPMSNPDSITVTAPPIPPTASFGTDPIDNYNSTNQSIIFKLSCSDNLGVSTLQLWGNWTGIWHANQTNSSPVNDSVWSIQVNNIPEGKGHIWGVWCNDSLGGEDWTNNNRTFTVDTTAPTITLPVYTNATPKKSSDSLIVNISVDDGSGMGVDSCVINVATATTGNQTIAYSNGWCNGTYSLEDANEGNQTINAYANDTLNNWGLNDSYVVWIDNTGPTINNENSNETNISQNLYFCLNITATDIPSGVDTVYAEVWNTTHWLNYSMSDTGTTSCDGISGDYIYGVEIQGSATGLWNYSKAHANDTLNNWNSSDFADLTINVTAPADSFPTVNIIYPENITYNVNVSVLNYTAEDDINLSHCWYSTDGGASNSSPDVDCSNHTDLISSEDSNTWTVYANDSIGQESSDSVTFFKDTIYPLISITYPENINYTTNVSELNYTFTETNCDRVWWNNGTDNSTPQICGTNWTDLISKEGSNTWTVYINDTSGNENSSSVTFNKDTVYPAVTINSPLNQTYNTKTIIFNITATNSSDVDSCWYSLTAGSYNYSMAETNPPEWDDTNSSMTQGSHTVNFYCNDTSNNLNDTEQKTFFIDSIYPLIDFTTGTEDNATTYSRNWIFVNVTVTEDNEDTIIFSLYNQTSLVNETIYTNQQRTINWTGLPNAIYYYNVTINDTAGNSNLTETRIIILDTEGPQVSSLTESPTDPANYSEGGIYMFNATVTDPSLDTVWVDFNGTNYTATPLGSDIYNITLSDLSVGNYSYRWYANDSFSNLNDSENGTYTINQGTPSLNITFSPSDNESYGTETTVNGTGCPSQLTCNLYRNDTGEITPPDVATLGVGVYNYTYNTTGNINYTSASVSDNLTVNQATGLVYTYVNNLQSNITIEQYTEIYLNGTLETGQAGDTIKLYYNNTLIEQGVPPLSNLTNFTTIGLFNITTIYDGNENYTSAYETWWVNVSEADVTPPQISIIHPQNISYDSVQTQLNYTASDNFGLNYCECWYSLNEGETNTTITCGQNITGLNSGQGSSTWTIWANDTKGNENSSSVTFFVDSIAPTIQFVDFTETSGTSLGRNYIQINVTASDDNLDTITIRLYNSTNLLQTNTSTSPFPINYIGLSAGTYYFNATANDTLNNQDSTETKNVTLILPSLTIIKPKNETYMTKEDLPLKYSANYEDTVKYNIDLGENTTITSNTTFSVSSQGSHTLYLYANNTVGTTSKNVTFTIDSNKFKVYYDEYNDANKGNSTNFNESSYSEIQNLSNVVLENTDYGKISFNEVINMTDDENISDNEVDLDSHTNISENHIEINSTALPNLNKSSTLYFYNLSLTNPRALREEIVCPSEICTSPVYSSGTWRFNVTGFTVYSLEETPAGVISPPTAPGAPSAKGDGYECQNNSECEEDEICWNYQCVKLFDIKIIDFESPVELGDFFDFTYLVKGMAKINDDVEIKFWIEKDGEKVTSGSDIIYLGSFEEKTETTKIFLPTGIKSGVYTFYIQVSHRAYEAKSHRTIEISVKEGIAIITQIEKNLKTYIIFGLIIFILFLLLVFYIKRKKRISIEPTRLMIKKPKEKKQIFMPRRYSLKDALRSIETAYLRIRYKLKLIFERIKEKIKKKETAEELIKSVKEKKKSAEELIKEVKIETIKPKEKTEDIIEDIIEKERKSKLKPKIIKQQKPIYKPTKKPEDIIEDIIRKQRKSKLKPKIIEQQKIIYKPKKKPEELQKKKIEIKEDDEEALEEMFEEEEPEEEIREIPREEKEEKKE